ncbi:MAG: hypothetical protein KJO98_07835 [Rhodothermia bacterium]|nr:hypothetical protein [Rhodothermia bacterium]
MRQEPGCDTSRNYSDRDPYHTTRIFIVIMGMRLVTCLGVGAIALLGATQSFAQRGFSLDAEPVPVSTVSDPGRPVFVDLNSSGGIRRVGVGQSTIALDGGAGAGRFELGGTIVGTSVSKSGRFLAVLVLVDGAAAQSGGLELHVLSNDLDLVYRVPLRHGDDEPYPGLSVDGRDGSVAVLWHAKGSVTFLSPSGARVADIRLTNGLHDIERAILASRADRSGQIALAVNEPVTDGVRSVAARQVRIFSSTGEPVSVFDLPSFALSSMAMSEDGERIGIGAYDVPSGVYQTTVFDRAGTELYRTDFAAESIEFDAAGTHALVSNKRRVAIVDHEAARSVMEYRLSDSSARSLSAALSADGRFAVAVVGRTAFDAGRFKYTDMQLVEFVRGSEGTFTTKTRPIAGTAETIRADVEEFGVAVSLDETTLLFRRP